MEMMLGGERGGFWKVDGGGISFFFFFCVTKHLIGSFLPFLFLLST